MDVGKALSQGRQCLFGESEHPARDAAVLLSHVLNCSAADFYLHPEKRITQEDYREYSSHLARRVLKEPISYIIGVREFMGLEFMVDKRVLIPRPETEILVETALSIIKGVMRGPRQEPVTVCDVCCGSGAVGLSILKSLSGFDDEPHKPFPRVRVILTDVSEKALDVARENAVRLNVMEEAEFWLGDGLKPVEELGLVGKVDVIVTNPPYVAEEALSSLDEEIKNYEPILALDGGPQGMDFIKMMITQAPFVLAPSGTLLMEIGHDQADKCQEIFTSSLHTTKTPISSAGRPRASWDKWRFVRDYGGKKRILVAQVHP